MAAPPRRTQGERVAESTQRLVEAAIALIAERGYEATTAAEIGIRAGYSREMVRARYGTKEALVDEIMRTEYEPRINVPISAGATGLERVLAPIEGMRQMARNEPQFLRAMFVLNLDAATGGETALSSRIKDWVERMESHLADAVRAGRKDGSIRADVKPLPTARALVSMGAGIAYHSVLRPEAFDLPAEVARWRRRVEAELST